MDEATRAALRLHNLGLGSFPCPAGRRVTAQRSDGSPFNCSRRPLLGLRGRICRGNVSRASSDTMRRGERGEPFF